jgi:regulator of sirC expression with transglutaminase-like and TPR domain
MPDETIDLGETALLLAELDLPDSELDSFRQHLRDLVRDVGEAGKDAATPELRARVLADVIAEAYGYEGDQRDFDNPLNANLISVIERRRGLPVTLGVLYIHAGRALGWMVNGLNFPNHFLVCVGEGDGMVVMDPFQSGRLLTEQDLQGYLQRVRGPNARLKASDLGFLDNRGVLVRLLSNIRQRAANGKNYERALEVAERMVLFAPEHPGVLYDFAVLSAQVGHLSTALEALADSARFSSDEKGRTRALSMLESVKRRLN